MKFVFESQVKKWCAALAVVSFFAVAVFSVGTGMNMDDMGNMSPCAFMSGGETVCPMGVLQHLNEWEGFFSPISKVFSVFLLLVVAVFIRKGFFAQEYARQKRKQIYAANFFYLKSLNFLVYAFSRGILNSRRYKFAII
jgi:hypothetical protein